MRVHRHIARDLMDEGIRVNSILPGLFDTPLLQGAPGEFAAVVETLVVNGYFNGASVRLDGAIRMAPRAEPRQAFAFSRSPSNSQLPVGDASATRTQS